MAQSTAFPAVNGGQQIGSCSTGVAVRSSVARTRRAFAGTAVAASSVTSETEGLLIAYPSVECNV